MEPGSDGHEAIRARPILRAPLVTPVQEPTARLSEPSATPSGRWVSPNTAPGWPPSDAPYDDSLVVRQPRREVFLDLVVGTAGFFVALVLLELFAAVASGGDPARSSNGWVWVAQRAILSVVTICLITGLLMRNEQPLRSIGVRADRPMPALLWGVVAYATILGYVLTVSTVVNLIWPGAARAMEELERGHMQRLPPMNLAQMILFSLGVAVSEEVLFRGFIMTRLRSLTGSWAVAILLISAAFAVLHIPQGGLAVSVIFGLSVLLGIWMVWRRNVLVPILAHALFDTTSLAVLNYAVR